MKNEWELAKARRYGSSPGGKVSINVVLSLAEFALWQSFCYGKSNGKKCEALGVFNLGHNGLPLRGFKKIDDVN